jgi:HSP20 family protein
MKFKKERIFQFATISLLAFVAIQGVSWAKATTNTPPIKLTLKQKGSTPINQSCPNKQVQYVNPIVVLDPFAEMERMQAEMNRVFNESFNHFRANPQFKGFSQQAFAPALDLQDKGDQYEVRLDLPGVKKSDISIKLSGNTLVISGKTDQKIEKKGKGFITTERRSGSFMRSLTFPQPVNETKIDAKYENGVLIISAPKLKAQKPVKKIPIK